MKKYIISWGGGVNSTAILAMMKLGMLPKFTKENSYFVFADTCAEKPFFYEHTSLCLMPMARDGWNVKKVAPYFTPEYYSNKFKDVGLVDFCINFTIMPSRVNRWCTMEYKSKPIKAYRETLGEDTVLVLGIGHDEQHRAKARYAKDTCYPLIEHEIDRGKCFDLAKQAGLPKPEKTGCWMCPYQRKSQWIELYMNDRELFNKAQELEDNARTKYEGKAYYFIRDIRLTEQVEKWLRKEKENCKQQEFEEFGLDQHCFCAD